MKLETGQKLGPYEILSALGAGGMGEVYRARDTRLERDVAIKVLPHGLGTNPEALARFEREAKAVAALSHPNIMAIHDFGEHDGIVYAAIELLEGETLREALEPGPLPVRKATDYARQAARGLGAAHDSGIVHRDLKPENIFVTREGRIKILDFGLARTAEEESGDLPEDSATRTHLTSMGTVLGTINYMSPEQARGETAVPASDIFSLGTVLFEMLHGRRPFERETAPETLTAILREDPPEILLSDSGASFSVQRIIQRCLEKRPEERFQSAHDLAFALETSSGATSGVAPITDAGVKAGKSRRSFVLPMLLLLTIGLLVGAFLGKQFSKPPVAQSVKTTPITFSGFDANPAASPDGRTIVFSSRRAAATGIWLKQLKGGSEVPLTRGEDVLPRFSPDGSTVLFIRNEAEQFSIYRIPLVGGQPRKLIDNAGEADWSPDGSQVVFFRGESGDSSIWTAGADGSGQRKIAGLTNQVFSSPRWSPDGRTIAFVSAPSNNNISLSIFLMDVESGKISKLPPERPSLSGLAWSGTGDHLVFAWSEDLLSGLASSSVQVSMQNVTNGETTHLFWARNLLRAQLGTRIDIAGDGRLVYSMVHTAQNLREIRRDENGPDQVRTVTSGSSADRQPNYAPDGETVLFSSNRNGNLDLWTIHTGTGVVKQLTDDEARDWDPTWSADGSKVIWSSDRGGNLEIWIADADGSGARQVSHDGVDAENPSITPDGEWIVYMTSNPGKSGMWKVRVNGKDTTQLWSGAGFIPEMSPDGKYVSFATVSGSNLTTIMVLDMETGETSTFSQLPRSSNFTSGAEGRSRWTSDGKAIAFIALQDNQTGVVIQDFIPGRDTSATQRKFAGFDAEWITESFAISPDGKRVMLARIRPGGTVMMAENVPLITRP